MYYIPATKQPRQYHTKRVALYLPSSLRHPGAVVFSATVLSVEVVFRSEIATPWKSAHPDSQQTLYRLDSFQTLDRPVENRPYGGRGSGPRRPRWTSRLALERASTLQELLLETEPEWRLYEDLRASGFRFGVEAGRVTLQDAEDPRGRAIFTVGNVRIQFCGAAGFAVLWPASEKRYFPKSAEVLTALEDRRAHSK